VQPRPSRTDNRAKNSELLLGDANYHRELMLQNWPACGASNMTEISEDTVRAEVRAWLEANWSLDYGLLEWRLKLAEPRWGVPQRRAGAAATFPSAWYRPRRSNHVSGSYTRPEGGGSPPFRTFGSTNTLTSRMTLCGRPTFAIVAGHKK
jgi:hypothetical protein